MFDVPVKITDLDKVTRNQQGKIEIKNTVDLNVTYFNNQTDSKESNEVITTVDWPGQLSLKKEIDKELIEAGNEIDPAKPTDINPTLFKYTLTGKNESSIALKKIRILDILPFNGDSRNSDFDASYKVKAVTASDSTGVIYYHLGTIAETTDPNSLTLNAANGWIKLSDDPTKLEKAKAIVVEVPKVSKGEEVKVNISIQPADQKAGDHFVNDFVLNSELDSVNHSNEVKTDVLGRDLSGIAWYDDDLDGLIGNKPSGSLRRSYGIIEKVILVRKEKCMKKIVIGVCGILVFIGGLAGIRSGVLKAGELTEDSSIIVETGTSDVSVPESNEVPTDEVEPTAEAPIEAQPQPEIPVEAAPETSVPAASSEAVPEASSEPAPVESSTVDSSTSTDSTASSSSSSTSSSSSNSSTSSTTKPSSSTKPSNSTKPSQTKPSSTTPSSSAPTQSSTSQSQATPASSVAPTPIVPSTPAAMAPVTPATPSVQANSFVAPTAPEAFSETSTLNLPSELKTTEVAQSDLKGFELPLLSSFENKAHAAMIYEGIKQLGTEQEEDYSAEQLAQEMYQNLFDSEITDKPEKIPEEITVGSLVYQKKKDKNVLLGVYIGDDYYLTVDDVEVEEASDTEESAATETSNDEKTEKETQRQVVVESIDLEEDLLVQELPKVTLTEHGEQTLAEYPASMNFTENEGAKTFIEKIAEDAQKLGQEYDVFASVMIAQALLESGSGTSMLSLTPNHKFDQTNLTHKAVQTLWGKGYRINPELLDRISRNEAFSKVVSSG